MSFLGQGIIAAIESNLKERRSMSVMTAPTTSTLPECAEYERERESRGETNVSTTNESVCVRERVRYAGVQENGLLHR